MTFDAYLESIDFIPLHFAFCLAGALLCIAVMQLSTRHGDLLGENHFQIILRRVALTGLGLALLWASSYSATKGWQPWPPDVLIIAVLDVVLGIRMVSILLRCRQLHFFDVPRRHDRGSAFVPTSKLDRQR